MSENGDAVSLIIIIYTVRRDVLLVVNERPVNVVDVISIRCGVPAAKRSRFLQSHLAQLLLLYTCYNLNGCFAASSWVN